MAGSMSDEESSPRRKSDSEAGSHRGSVPKRRVPKGIKKRKAKSPVRARTPLPFFEKDQYTDLEIVVMYNCSQQHHPSRRTTSIQRLTLNQR